MINSRRVRIYVHGRDLDPNLTVFKAQQVTVVDKLVVTCSALDYSNGFGRNKLKQLVEELQSIKTNNPSPWCDIGLYWRDAHDE